MTQASVWFTGVDCNTPFGSSQQLAAADACAQTLCADQNEFPVSPSNTRKPFYLSMPDAN